MLPDETIARSFRALSHPRRAMIFRLLVERPANGQSLDRLIAASGLPASSLVHHLREMERAGLLRRRRRGTYVGFAITPTEMARVLARVISMSEATAARPAWAA